VNAPVNETLAYDVVDVFADGPFAGNQLAVVHGTGGLATEQLQAIASEFGFSETTFPVPAASGDRYDVRIFTPTQELPFAGHPTLGTAWVLRDLGLVSGDAVVQWCAAGDIPVRFAGEDLVELTGTPDPVVGPLDPDVVASLLDAVGLTAADADGDAYVTGTGLPWIHVPVRVDALVRARRPVLLVTDVIPDDGPGADGAGPALVAIDPGGVGSDEPLQVRSRVFSMDGDAFEDPATGSAAASLGVALVARGLLGDGGRAQITQGVEMGRPSRLDVRVDVVDDAATKVHVAGRVHRTMTGRIAVPPG
jgi:trans-2,3-dihydro-3-hydroxyanthranilate isomerase